MTTRTFSAKLKKEPDSKFRGRFVGRIPSQAAHKAMRSLLAEDGKKTGAFDLVLREITQGSNHKTYEYKGSRMKNPEPVTLARSGTTNPIVYKHKTEVFRVYN
jgi:hypothetical protein